MLLEVVKRYSAIAFDVSQIELQKLFYFLEVHGNGLNLNFKKDRYGPYAPEIAPMLRRLEGHYLVGYGDGSKSVHDGEPIRLLEGAQEAATKVLGDNATFDESITEVLQLVEGFESSYGLELLATVHWCVTHNGSAETDPLAVASDCVSSWNQRKKSLFTEDHIRAAFNNLVDHKMIEDARRSTEPSK